MSYIVWWIANGQIDNKLKLTDLCVIPAQAGIQATVEVLDSCYPLPAFAGTSLHLRKQVRAQASQE